MAEIVNLRRARKTKARAAAAKQADVNRAKFGRTKRERVQSETNSARAAREIDGKRLDK